jgi:hypothetical protein
MRQQGHGIVATDVFLDLLLRVGVLRRWSSGSGSRPYLLDAAQGQVQGMLLLALFSDLGHKHTYLLHQGLKQALQLFHGGEPLGNIVDGDRCPLPRLGTSSGTHGGRT